jgi:hypothetical protein
MHLSSSSYVPNDVKYLKKNLASYGRNPQTFRRPFRFHLQDTPTLTMEAAGSETSVSTSRVKSIPKDVTLGLSETSLIFYQTSRRHIQTDSILDSNRPEALKSHTVKLSVVILSEARR